MRHRVKSVRLNRPSSQLRALVRSLVTSVILYEHIETTRDKAKLARGVVDRIIVTAKKKDKMNAIREVARYVFTKESSIELFSNIKILLKIFQY